MKFTKTFLLLAFLMLLIGCSVKTTDAEEAYEYWAGSEPPKELQLINGQYQQSGHFTLEYELFLKFKTDKKWFDEFVRYNGFQVDSVGNDWTRWTELPDWFKPDKNYLIYCKDQNDQFERSRYFINPKTGVCYIYESVGM